MATPTSDQQPDGQESTLFVSPDSSPIMDAVDNQDQPSSNQARQTLADFANIADAEIEAMVRKSQNMGNEFMRINPRLLEQVQMSADYFGISDNNLQNPAKDVVVDLTKDDEAEIEHDFESTGPRAGVPVDSFIKFEEPEDDGDFKDENLIRADSPQQHPSPPSHGKKRKGVSSKEVDQPTTNRAKRPRKSAAKNMDNIEPGSSTHRKGKRSAKLADHSGNGAANLRQVGQSYHGNEAHQNTDVLEDVERTRLLPAQPKFDEGTSERRKALRQIEQSVSAEHREAAKTDRILCEEQMKKIKRRLRMVEEGKWLLTGMKTSMPTYQVLGLAFMRGREKDENSPTGGILADQMGLGKTVMMLANILDGTPRKAKHRKQMPHTTLIVAAPALIAQWEREIKKHCHTRVRPDSTDPLDHHPNGIGKVIRHIAGDKLYGSETQIIRKIEKSEILFTTYRMISKSYDRKKAPSHVTGEKERLEWEERDLEERKGFLHKVRFLRVVLDEAHAIKNFESKTSQACRALQARHRWAITGTPVMNRNDEFYPYFLFLGVKDLAMFQNNSEQLNNLDDSARQESLQSLVQKFLIRRTHGSVLFGARLVELPEARFTTIYVQFTPLEQMLYQVVRTRFLLQIKKMCKDGITREMYPHILVLILRLRMMCAHFLLTQEVLEDLMTREDYEQLKHFVHNSKEDRGDGKKILFNLAGVIEQGKIDAEWATDRSKPIQVHQGTITDDMDMPAYGLDCLGGSHGHDTDFSGYLKVLTKSPAWREIVQRSKCNRCFVSTTHVQRSTCFHIYCPQCMSSLQNEADRQGDRYAKCLSCKSEIREITECQRARIPDADFDTSDDETRPARKDDKWNWIKKFVDPIASAKSRAVKAQIISWMEDEPCVKIIVYTQFLDFLEILKKICNVEGWKFVTYSGKMTMKARDQAILNFSETPDIQIMLASLHCGSFGLNLTMASRVICVDPWWNNPVEQQAFCRVFRIGQTKETSMTRIVVRDSIDEKLMTMKGKKEHQISRVMDDENLEHGLTFEEAMELVNENGGSNQAADDGRVAT